MDLWALYRQTATERGNNTPLVLGLFDSVVDAQATVHAAERPDVEWRPPRPGRRRWELQTDNYLYIVEQFTVHARADAPKDDPIASEATDETTAVPIDRLRELETHISEWAEESAAAARESHEHWTLSRNAGDSDQMRRMRGNVRFYLGQAAAFTWMVTCLDQLISYQSESRDDLLKRPWVRERLTFATQVLAEQGTTSLKN